MSEFIRYGLPCESCGSSDAYAIAEDGHGFCFSCNKYDKKGAKVDDNENFEDTNVSYGLVDNYRGINRSSLDLFGCVFKINRNGSPLELCYFYDKEGDAYKVKNLREDRTRKDKYRTSGPIGKAGLFGKNAFAPGSREFLTITEGEDDAIAAYQMLDGKSACASVQSSSSALRDCTNDFDWCNSFKKIIICFDNDEVGRKAAKKVNSLFSPDKVVNVTLDKFKDATEYLENKNKLEFVSSWKSAKRLSDDSFINTFEEVAQSLADANYDICGTYPLEDLQNALRGLVRGEMVVFKGLEGIGKTELFRAIEYHNLKTNPSSKIGAIHMEEDRSTTIQGIATYEAEYPMYFEEDGVSNDDILEAYKKAVDGNENRFFIYKINGGDDPDDILMSIRMLVVGSGVDIILLDNINKMVDSLEEDTERQKLVYLASKLKAMAMELRFALLLISHVNDEGKTLGSRYTAKVADKVIHMSRDINSFDEKEANTIKFRIEKGRKARRQGDGGSMLFNSETFKLTERKED